MIKVNHKYCLANSIVYIMPSFMYLCVWYTLPRVWIFYRSTCFVMLFISGRLTAQCIVYNHAIDERTRHGVIWTLYPTSHVLQNDSSDASVCWVTFKWSFMGHVSPRWSAFILYLTLFALFCVVALTIILDSINWKTL